MRFIPVRTSFRRDVTTRDPDNPGPGRHWTGSSSLRSVSELQSVGTVTRDTGEENGRTTTPSKYWRETESKE